MRKDFEYKTDEQAIMKAEVASFRHHFLFNVT